MTMFMMVHVSYCTQSITIQIRVCFKNGIKWTEHPSRRFHRSWNDQKNRWRWINSKLLPSDSLYCTDLSRRSRNSSINGLLPRKPFGEIKQLTVMVDIKKKMDTDKWHLARTWGIFVLIMEQSWFAKSHWICLLAKTYMHTDLSLI